MVLYFNMQVADFRLGHYVINNSINIIKSQSICED